jgi:uncharacterized protein (DUF1501 family)
LNNIFMNSTRRELLAMLAAAGATLPYTSQSARASAPMLRAFAHSLAPTSILAGGNDDDDTVLLVVRLFGGNDGLNTVVPYHDENYYKARRDDQYDVSIKPETVLPLHNSSTLGLHPSLKPLHTLYGEQKVLIVQNVGYAEQDLSHFRSNDIWLTATNPQVYDQSGWLGRFLETRYPDYPNVLPDAPFAIEMGRGLGRTFMGRNAVMGMNLADISFVPAKPVPQLNSGSKTSQELDFVSQMMRQSNVFLNEINRVHNRQRTNNVQYPDTDWARQMAAAARLIGGGLKTRLYMINTSLWDFHHSQIADQAWMLRDLADALFAFQRDIEAFGIARRVTVLTVSEFGRRLETNSSGTDHGAASCLFLVGERVNSGVIGHDPDCSSTDANGNLRHEYDFRQIYASVLSQWLRATPHEISPALMEHQFAQLPLFKGSGAQEWLHSPSTESRLDAASNEIRVSHVFPNPASSQCTIAVKRIPRNDSANGYSISERSANGLHNSANLTVSDMKGTIMFQTKTVMQQEESEFMLDVRAWGRGNYVARLEIGSLRFVRLFAVV